jgi:dipeptidyl aminopeptidase/acylaminoacyl peptidase
MAQVGCPVLLVHGTEDEMVPVNDARRLLAAGQLGEVELIEVAGRHDPSDALLAHLPKLTAFLQRTAGGQVPESRQLV